MQVTTPEGSRTRTALGLVLLLNLLLCAVAVGWGLPSYSSWDAEEIVPSVVLEARDWPAGQPHLHRYLLRIVFAPAEAAAAIGLVPGHWYGFHNLSFFLGRLLSVLMAAGAVYLVYRCGRELGSRVEGLAAAAIVAVLPPVAFYGKTIQLQIPALFWFTLSLLFFLRLLRRHRTGDYLLFAVAAACAVSTRSGIAWTYLLAPAAVWASLSKRSKPGGPVRRLAGAVTAWRPWLAAVCALVVVALVGDLPGQLVRLTGDVAAADPAATARAMRLLAASMSWPGLITGLVGATMLAADRRWRGLAPLLLALMLLLGLGSEDVSPQGFLLPLAAVVALAGGRLFGRSGLSDVRGRALLVAIVGLVCLLAVRSLAFDIGLMTDQRAGLEDWLDEQAADRRTAALGAPHLLLRGTLPVTWEEVEVDPCRLFDRIGAVRLVVDRRDDGAPETLLARLEDGEFGYDPLVRAPARRLPELGGPAWAFDLARLDQELLILERSLRPCVDPDGFRRALTELGRSRDPELRRILANVLLRDRPLMKSVPEPVHVATLGLRSGGWTYGTRLAAVAVANDREQPVVPRLRLGCRAPASELPVSVEIDVGDEILEVVFDRAGGRSVDLPPLAAGEALLALVRADKAWRLEGLEAPDEARPLGVRLVKVTLVPR